MLQEQSTPNQYLEPRYSAMEVRHVPFCFFQAPPVFCGFHNSTRLSGLCCVGQIRVTVAVAIPSLFSDALLRSCWNLKIPTRCPRLLLPRSLNLYRSVVYRKTWHHAWKSQYNDGIQGVPFRKNTSVWDTRWMSVFCFAVSRLLAKRVGGSYRLHYQTSQAMR